jgi:hypothetical protein
MDVGFAGASPPEREQYGFRRTECACACCAAPCGYLPGALDVADLARLCPPGQDLFAWAEQHLRALTDKPFPTLVPARQADGRCHWLFGGRCAVHAAAPYGCAFFDSHMAADEEQRRSAATIRARREDAAQHGVYHRVWLHLLRKGLVGRPGDRDAVAGERRKARRGAERQRRRQAP